MGAGTSEYSKCPTTPFSVMDTVVVVTVHIQACTKVGYSVFAWGGVLRYKILHFRKDPFRDKSDSFGGSMFEQDS